LVTLMKSRQFCSVCKEWLEMEVVPTSDGEDDDGVIWFRCPQCQGFLPKLSGADLQPDSADEPVPEESTTGDDAPETPASPSAPAAADTTDKKIVWDSPADMMAARKEAGGDVPHPGLEESDTDAPEVQAKDTSSPAKSAEASEPLHEYAALLAEKDQSDPTPYRPWESYEVGQCIHHMAWEECGVVVAKETLPGNRQVIKCYFEEAGVVRLIEMAPR
jgi:hypothetical protein